MQPNQSDFGKAFVALGLYVAHIKANADIFEQTASKRSATEEEQEIEEGGEGVMTETQKETDESFGFQQSDHDELVRIRTKVDNIENSIEKFDAKLETVRDQIQGIRWEMLTAASLQAMEARLMAAIDKKASNERVDSLSTEIKAETRTDFGVLNTKVEERTTSVKWFIATVTSVLGVVLGLLGVALKYDFFTPSKDATQHMSGHSRKRQQRAGHHRRSHPQHRAKTFSPSLRLRALEFTLPEIDDVVQVQRSLGEA